MGEGLRRCRPTEGAGLVAVISETDVPPPWAPSPEALCGPACPHQLPHAGLEAFPVQPGAGGMALVFVSKGQEAAGGPGEQRSAQRSPPTQQTCTHLLPSPAPGFQPLLPHPFSSLAATAELLQDAPQTALGVGLLCLDHLLHIV